MIEPTLNKLKEPVLEEMELFQKEFEKGIQSDVSLINTITQYILSQNSKKIRPILLILCAKLCGEPNELSYISASLVEILHTATLVHDDIVDEAETRRGLPSVKAIWKNKVAVLLGDYLFSKSLNGMIKLRNFDALELLSKTSELLSSGEILQIEKSFSDGMDEDIYYKMIWAKTASLFATGCKLGAITVNASPEVCDSLYRYGKYLGMAFQIKDDLFDYDGCHSNIGKPIGRDIKENMITLPLIYTLNILPRSDSRKLRKNLKKGFPKKEVEKINALVKETGGVDYALSKLHELSELAVEQLSSFPDSEIKQSLIGFTVYNEKRVS
ncbi:MAG: polyprenyl synthetase family protein [Candidatus Neomarinimicrobiota bacterium]|nr:MAG: polyprenyl synthetase family protein [Candidatus Neomarinimicrobiota bacterium]